MQIAVDAKRALIACQAAKRKAEEAITIFKDTNLDRGFNELVDRASNNGYAITDSVKAEMRGVAERDLEQALAHHPATEVIQAMIIMSAMCEFVIGLNPEDSVIIDELDFQHLREHLVTKEGNVEQKAA